MDEDDFVDSYIETALWSSTDDDGEPLDNEYVEDDINTETLEKMEDDAREFWGANQQLLAVDDNDARHGGHNFWLTRNGHGAGFWDGDYPTYGDKLTENSKAYGEYNLYVGDDGEIYGS